MHLIRSYIEVVEPTGLGLIGSAGVNRRRASRTAKFPPLAECDAWETFVVAPDVLTCVPLLDATTVAAVRRIYESRVIIDCELRNRLDIDKI
jgi:hypothetical protein